MAACKVISEVLIEAAAHPGTAIYICQASVVGGPVAAPKICAASIGYNQLLQNPGFKTLNKQVAEIGCVIAVEAGTSVHRIMVVEGAKTVEDFKEASHQAKRTFRALNTQAGIQWLMRQMAP